MDAVPQKMALLQRRPCVFVTQEQAFDFSLAQEFGEIEFLTNDDLRNIKGSVHNETLLRDLRRKLRRFDPNQDWMLVAGSPYVTAAVFMILGSLGVRKVQILRWSNRDSHYLPLHLDLPFTDDRG